MYPAQGLGASGSGFNSHDYYRVYRRHFLQYSLIVCVTETQKKVTAVVLYYLTEQEVADSKRIASELKGKLSRFSIFTPVASSTAP